jgi:hypothetical protein
MPEEYKPYVVQQGDHGERLALRAGAPPDDVWNHPKNAELKRKRKRMDVLLPGDIIHLPARQAPGLKVTKETKNRFKATIGRKKTQVRLVGLDGQALANEPYEIRGLPMHAGDDPPSGRSDGDGVVEVDVPTTAIEFELYLPNLKHSLFMLVGGMDPSDERSGTLRRLENLGYIAVRGNVSDALLEAALRAFQEDHDLEVTGQDDDATRGKLGEVCKD